MSNCMDCLYVKVCSDFNTQGCCDADCCSDFEPKVDFLHLKHHIGDHLYDVANNTIVTYTISGVTFLDGEVRYELTSDNLRAQRTHILESEISSLFLDYDSAASQLNPAICESCFHHSVCDPALLCVSAPLCKHYVRSSSVALYPCYVGQVFYVVKPAAEAFGIEVPAAIEKYTVDRMFISTLGRHNSESVVLRNDQGHHISISGFENFTRMVGHVFFHTQEAAARKLDSCIHISTPTQGGA